jgi:predicted DNA-binding transcriptional regulator AlpA
MEGYLTTSDIADRLGIQRESVHRYLTRGDIPQPDERAGRTLLWRVDTIEEWIAGRPGHAWRKGQAKGPRRHDERWRQRS